MTAVSGRDLEGARRAAAELAVQLAHPVAAAADAFTLARDVDVLVVASPVKAHLDGLDAALAASVPCLCEKPLVDRRDEAAGAARIAAFAARGIVLQENCQWPCVLPALFELHPQLTGVRPRHVAMGLGPAGKGLTMVEDSLSHVLSVVQALGCTGPDTVVSDVRTTDPGPQAERNVVSFSLAGTAGAVAVELHLEHCPQQPRPAWIAVDGLRIDRRIGAGYVQSFVTPDGRARNVGDPLHELVYRFALNLQAKPRERTAAFDPSLDVRLRLYAAILRTLDGAAEGR